MLSERDKGRKRGREIEEFDSRSSFRSSRSSRSSGVRSSQEFEEFEEFGSSLMPGVREFQEFGSLLVPGVRGVRRVREFADPSSSRSSTSAVFRGVDSSEEFDFRSSSRS